MFNSLPYAPSPSSLQRTLFPLLVSMTAAACGGDSGSPSAPSSSTSSVTVTVSTPLRMGQTTQASGTATQSNGQSQPITTGWLSDQPSVATVTTAGLIAGISNGQATIYVISGGRQGQQVLRIVPDYHGKWFGALRVASCTQTGVFLTAGFCSDFPVNESGDFDLTLAQAGEAMKATVFFGDFAPDQTVDAPIPPDGRSTFTATATAEDEGLQFTWESTWQVASARVGELAGPVNDTFRVAGFTGEARVAFSIQGASRTSTTARASRSTARIHRAMRRLGSLQR